MTGTSYRADIHFLHWYIARVERVVDGDTVDLWLDLGCTVSVKKRVRLNRINAWEVTGEHKEKGKAATAWLSDLILDTDIIIKTQLDKTGKFGRLLADLYLPGELCLNDEMVRLGHAVYQDY